MEASGKFVELATIDNNVINVDENLLRTLFHNNETEDAFVAIISVLGCPRIGKSKLLGKMLQYFVSENKVFVDDEVALKIPNFGDDPIENRKSVVTWSQPIFVVQGVSKKVAIYLLDIKGKYEGSEDKEFIILSGLCAFISSSIIYLHGDHVDETSWLHLKNIAAEGLRFIGNKQLLVHQKLTYVIQNWTKPEEYVPGDTDSKKFSDNLKDKFKGSKLKVFSAFTQFDFFLLPKENEKRYSFFHRKLLTITLHQSYLIPKMFGAKIKAWDVESYIASHLDEVKYKDDFSWKLEDINCFSEKVELAGTFRQQEIPKSESGGLSYYDRMVKEEKKDYTDNFYGTETSDNTSTNQTIGTDSLKQPSELQYAGASRKGFELATKIESKDTMNAYLEETGKGRLTSITDATKVDRLDLRNQIQGITLPQHTTKVLINNFSSPAKKDSIHRKHLDQIEPVPKESEKEIHSQPTKTRPSTAADILKQINLKFASGNAAVEKVEEEPKPTPAPRRLNTRTSIPDPIPPSTLPEIVPIKQPRPRSSYFILPNSEPPIRTLDTNLRESSDRPMVISPILEIDTKFLHQVICKMYKESPLSSNKSAVDILSDVTEYIGAPEKKALIYRETLTLRRAIFAVLKYIEVMESKFVQYLHYNQDEFRQLHNESYDLAKKLITHDSYLHTEIEEKINEARGEFFAYNSNVLEQETKIIDTVLKGVKEEYIRKMTVVTFSVTKKEKLLQIHSGIVDQLMKAVEITCPLGKSPLSSTLDRKLNTELTTLFVGIQSRNSFKLQELERKIDNATSTSKSQYELAMGGPIRLGTITDLGKFKDLHDTKFSDAMNKFEQHPHYKEMLELVPGIRKTLEVDLFKCHDSLKIKFEERLATAGKFKLYTVPHNDSRNLRGDHNINAPAQEGIPSECGIGIHMEPPGVTVSIFRNGKMDRRTILKYLVIGYNEEITVGDDSSNSDENFIHFSKIFSGNIEDQFRVKWNDKHYTLRIEECLYLLLSKWKHSFQEELRCQIKVCVIAVPSFISYREVRAIYDAASISGFETIKIIRDISSGAVGAVCFPQGERIPNQFALCNTITEVWGAGYFNIEKEFNATVISGVNYVGGKPRSEAIIKDIIKQLPDRQKVDVIVIGTKIGAADINDLKTNFQRHKKCVDLVIYRDKATVADGCALIAALWAGEKEAQSCWDKYNPSLHSVRPDYSWKTIDDPWDAPRKSWLCNRKPTGRNLRSENLLEIKQRLRHLVVRAEEATSEARTTLLEIGKEVQNGSFSNAGKTQMQALIDKTFTFLNRTNNEKVDIYEAVGKIKTAFNELLAKSQR